MRFASVQEIDQLLLLAILSLFTEQIDEVIVVGPSTPKGERLYV